MATATPRTLAVAPTESSAESLGAPLDTTVRVITPERIVFEYPLAGPFRRAFAYLIDLLTLIGLVIVAAVVSLILSLGSTWGVGLLLVAYFGLVWGYGALLETFLNGQTLGKRAAGIRVVSEQGVPITGAQAVLRNLVGAVDGMLPFAYMPALCAMMLTSRFQRLGDLAAGTMVIVEERQRRSGVLRVKEPEVEALLPWLPLRIAAGPELARALSDYVKRRERFNADVRDDMAKHLARPLRRKFGLPEDSSSDAVLCAVYHRVFLGE
ncbi:MAG: RDD family protein [Isosphaeraceae bacterium]